MEKMTKCKVCGNPVAKDAKICPHCGKKLNHPVFNTILTIITIIIIINFFKENIDLKGTTAYTAEELQSTVETDYKQTSNKIIEERSHTTLEEENIIDVTVDELNTLLEENALKASRTYKNKKVRLTGILTTIDSSGRYFSLGPLRGMSIFGNVTCRIEERHLDTVIDLVKGQKLTVEGKIISVGEVIGYTIEVEEVQKTKEESNDFAGATQPLDRSNAYQPTK
jgi:RNA polymerase subunit RPABC4/transcription elongation factor Spt4